MSEKKIKIVFILPTLTAGGAQRVMSFVAQKINRTKFDVTLLIIGFEKDTKYHVGETKTLYLNKKRVLHAFFPLISYFRKQKPHIVLSSLAHLNIFLAIISLVFPKIKFVVRETNVMSVLKQYKKSNKLYFSYSMITWAYRLIDCVICQSKDMQKDLVNNYNVSQAKTIIINNPITQDNVSEFIGREPSSPLKLITVGRLTKQKGHDRILQVLKKLTIPYTYTIIGNGHEKKRIFNTINDIGITDNIEYVEYTKNVMEYLNRNDVFLQGSYVEGFPNCLIESCVAGTPIVAFDAPGGLDEIIETGKNGIIVNSVDAFVNALTELYNNYYFLPEVVNATVTKKFNKEKIIEKYEALFMALYENNFNKK